MILNHRKTLLGVTFLLVIAGAARSQPARSNPVGTHCVVRATALSGAWGPSATRYIESTVATHFRGLVYANDRFQYWKLVIGTITRDAFRIRIYEKQQNLFVLAIHRTFNDKPQELVAEAPLWDPGTLTATGIPDSVDARHRIQDVLEEILTDEADLGRLFSLLRDHVPVAFGAAWVPDAPPAKPQMVLPVMWSEPGRRYQCAYAILGLAPALAELAAEPTSANAAPSMSILHSLTTGAKAPILDTASQQTHDGVVVVPRCLYKDGTDMYLPIAAEMRRMTFQEVHLKYRSSGALEPISICHSSRQ